MKKNFTKFLILFFAFHLFGEEKLDLEGFELLDGQRITEKNARRFFGYLFIIALPTVIVGVFSDFNLRVCAAAILCSVISAIYAFSQSDGVVLTTKYIWTKVEIRGVNKIGDITQTHLNSAIKRLKRELR
jgi:hypothetical protein